VYSKNVEIVFFLNGTLIYLHVNIIFDFPITYKNVSVPIRIRMSTSNRKHGSFLYKNNENTYPKGRALNVNVQSYPSNEKKELNPSHFPFSDTLFLSCSMVSLLQ